MTDRPILFSAPMVRALLDGRKTQTRRVLKPQPPEWATVCSAIFPPQGLFQWSEAEHDPTRPLKRWPEGHALRIRFGNADRLWVRETFSFHHAWSGVAPRDVVLDSAVYYWADGNPTEGDWTRPKPGIHMPRWASRLTLTVTDVRVQRLTECSEADALAEGVVQARDGQFIVPGVAHPSKDFGELSRVTAREMYAALWDVINGSGSWLANPWIVALTFTVERRNIDALPRNEP